MNISTRYAQDHLIKNITVAGQANKEVLAKAIGKLKLNEIEELIKAIHVTIEEVGPKYISCDFIDREVEFEFTPIQPVIYGVRPEFEEFKRDR